MSNEKMAKVAGYLPLPHASPARRYKITYCEVPLFLRGSNINRGYEYIVDGV